MPIYEYRCEACGLEMEAIQKMSDAALTDCPDCGQPTLKKLISAAGFRLKGGGWYETDFKKGGSKRNLHETGADKGAEKPAGKGSEKPAASPGDKAKPKPAEKTASSK